jgi:hypothetical protein
MRVFLALAIGLGASAAIAAPSPSKSDRAIFAAAGMVWKGGAWRSNCDDPGTAGYLGGAIERLGDLNGDGREEVIVTEGSSYCYGAAETAFWLLSAQPGGKWRLIHRDTGVPVMLKTRGMANWPDVAIGGPGFCFPVKRWNGTAYVPNRFEYEGKRCRPAR